MPTKIEWTDEVWNPVTGCTPVSEGCKNCYAKRMARRLAGRYGYPEKPNHFDVTLHPDRLERPLRWRKPRRVFVCSMGDLFHEDVPFEFIERVWDDFFDCSKVGQVRHVFQVLTKRSERMLEFAKWMNDKRFRAIDYDNVWIGVSAENQYTANGRIPYLLQIPAAVRFVSCEPLLESIDLSPFFPPFDWTYFPEMGDGVCYPYTGPDWVIAGGETGPGARPMHPDWARSLRDACQAAGVSYFFKQHGEWLHESQHPEWEKATEIREWLVGRQHEWPDGSISVKVGKKQSGRLLDGREWNEMPKVVRRQGELFNAQNA